MQSANNSNGAGSLPANNGKTYRNPGNPPGLTIEAIQAAVDQLRGSERGRYAIQGLQAFEAYVYSLDFQNQHAVLVLVRALMERPEFSREAISS